MLSFKITKYLMKVLFEINIKILVLLTWRL